MLPVWLAQAIETEYDRSKMEQLYDEYEQLLYRVALSYLHDEYKAEDAVHDTFLKLIDHLNGIGTVKCPQTKRFLVIIIKNICINMLKNKSGRAESYIVNDHEQQFIDALPDPYSNTEDAYCEQYDIKQVAEAVSTLPLLLRNTITLYAASGYTMKEIAEIEGCSTETIKKRIQRARMQIRKQLGDQL